MMHITCSEEKDGFVLIATLGILVILTIVGIAALTTGNLEIQLATKQKTHGKAFYKADSGAYITPKIIARTVENSIPPSLDHGAYTDADNGTSFKREVFGFVSSDPDDDIELAYGGDLVQISVQRLRSGNRMGSGVEFASGAEGIGSSGGYIDFGIDSIGHGPDSASANVFVKYREVIGMPGGY